MNLDQKLRQYLQHIAQNRQPVLYRDVVEALAIQPPHATHRVGLLLEKLMAEDAAAGRPFLAALVISRARFGAPAPGFFDMAAQLGRYQGSRDGEDAQAYHRTELEQALRHYGNCGASSSSSTSNV